MVSQRHSQDPENQKKNDLSLKVRKLNRDQLQYVGIKTGVSSKLIVSGMVRNITEYKRLDKAKLLNYIVWFIRSDPLDILEKETSINNALSEFETRKDIQKEEFDFDEKVSKENLGLLLSKLNYVASSLEFDTTNVKKHILIEGSKLIFSSPTVRWSEPMLEILEEWLKSLDFVQSDDEKFPTQNVGEWLLKKEFKKTLQEDGQQLLTLITKEEFLIISLIWIINDRVKQSIRNEMDREIFLIDEHIKIFDSAFLTSIIQLTEKYGVSLDCDSSEYKQTLENYCDKLYFKLGLKVHPFPWTIW